MAEPFFDYDTHLAAVATGDQHCFQELYHHEAPAMLALGKKLLNRSGDAEDLVRDTFVLIWRHAESYDPSMTSARAWIYSILRHRALQVLHHPARVGPTTANWTDSLPTARTSHADHGALYAAVQQLDPGQRRPLLMAYYHGYTYHQIAARLGSTAELVRRQMHTALTRIHHACRT